MEDRSIAAIDELLELPLEDLSIDDLPEDLEVVTCW